jgi:hypothetical protein
MYQMLTPDLSKTTCIYCANELKPLIIEDLNMKMNMLRWALPTILTIASSADLFAGARLQMSVTIPTVVQPFRVIETTMTIKNAGQGSIELVRLPDAQRIQLELVEHISKRALYKGPLKVEHVIEDGTGEDRPAIRLLPDEAISISLTLRCKWNTGRVQGMIFERPGTYGLRFEVPLTYLDQGKRNWEIVNSDWQQVVVSDPSPVEQKQIEALRKLPDFSMMFDPQDLADTTTADSQSTWIEQLGQFVKEHPNAYWTPYAKAAQAHIYAHRAAKAKNEGEQQRWRSLASETLRDVITNPNYVRTGAEPLEPGLSQQPGLVGPRPNTENSGSIDPVTQATKELESEFYDLKGYWRSFKELPWVREYSKKRLELYDRWAAGGITELERKQGEAALVREYVRKHAKPLPPAEWKRRYETYAKEEEAVRAKQMEELRQMIEAREKAKTK